MKRSVQVKLKNQFGVETVVPACNTAKLFADIAGTATLTKPTLRLIKELGYDVTIITPVKTLEEILG